MGPAGAAMAVALCAAAVAEPRLVDLVAPLDGRLVTRLENELRAGGFRPVRRRPDERPTAGVHGEVRWSGQGPIIARRASGDALEARFEDPGDDGVWAIRVVEWLRAEPLALAPPARHAPQVVTAPPDARFDVGLGAVAKGAPGTGVGFGLSAQAGVWLSPLLGLQLAVAGPTWMTVARDDVSALVREVAFHVRALVSFPIDERVRLLAGVGAGARNVLTVGLAPLERARASERTVFDAAAVFALRIGLSLRFFAELRAELSATLPPIALEFAGARVGLVNSPGVLGGLLLGARW